MNSSKLEFCEQCDIFIGGLFPIHGPKYARHSKKTPDDQFSSNSESINYFSTTTTMSVDSYIQSEIICGEIKKERGIQRLEAMLFAIDLINNSTNLLPNLKLGARIYDTCDRDTIAMEKSLNFVSDYFLLKEENIANDFTCLSNNPSLRDLANNFKPKKNKDAIHKRKVVGVIGAASSSVSIQVPQISYASTSPELSNKERFPFFSRVLPSDTLQAEAMANLVHSLNWNYIATLNEEGNLGGIDSFISNAKSKNICISGSYTLSQTASEDDVKAILMEMFEQKNARGVVVFLQDHNVRKLLKLVKDLNMTRHFLWIASDSWGTKIESIRSNNLAAEGAITFAPKSFIIKEFSNYFQKLRPGKNIRNPWFEEFWQDEFKCRIENPIFQSNRRPSYTKLCTGHETLNITQDGFIHFVIDSVFAIAHAIQDLIFAHCSKLNFNDLINCQHKIIFKGPDFLNAIRN
ncbi:metabotropic glutamate receptor 8-like isoform X1, partial [Brachionus plicatilis]